MTDLFSNWIGKSAVVSGGNPNFICCAPPPLIGEANIENVNIASSQFDIPAKCNFKRWPTIIQAMYPRRTKVRSRIFYQRKIVSRDMSTNNRKGTSREVGRSLII